MTGTGYVVGCRGAAGNLSGADVWLVFVFAFSFLSATHVRCSSSVQRPALMARRDTSVAGTVVRRLGGGCALPLGPWRSRPHTLSSMTSTGGKRGQTDPTRRREGGGSLSVPAGAVTSPWAQSPSSAGMERRGGTPADVPQRFVSGWFVVAPSPSVAAGRPGPKRVRPRVATPRCWRHHRGQGPRPPGP